MPLPSWPPSHRLSQQSLGLADTCLASRAAHNGPFMLLLSKHSRPGLLSPTEVREFSVRRSQWATGWERAQRTQCPAPRAGACAAAVAGLLYQPRSLQPCFLRCGVNPRPLCEGAGCPVCKSVRHQHRRRLSCEPRGRLDRPDSKHHKAPSLSSIKEPGQGGAGSSFKMSRASWREKVAPAAGQGTHRNSGVGMGTGSGFWSRGRRRTLRLPARGARER